MHDKIQMRDRNNIGAYLTIFAGICWGIISIFIRQLNSAGMDSFRIMSYRAWVSAFMLFGFLLIKDKSLLKFRIKDIWMFLGTGLLSLTFFSYCYFTSIIKSGAAIAVVLLYTSPIFVLILSVLFFKEKINIRKIIAIVMTFCGCALVSGIAGVGNSAEKLGIDGLLLGLGAGFGYALYSLFAGFALKKGYSSITISFYTFLFSGISLLFLKGPKNLFTASDVNSALWIVGVALICTVIPYISYTAGMNRIEVSKAAVLVTVEPLVGAMLGILAYGEGAGIGKITGIILILVSVVLLS